MATNNRIVTIRTIKHLPGRDANGNPIDETIDVKIRYGSVEWKNYLKNVLNTGMDKVSILNVKDEVVEGKKKTYNTIEIPQDIADEFNEAMKAKEKPLTEDQKKIAELEAKVEALMNQSKPQKPSEPKKTTESDDELAVLRKQYKEKAGAKADNRWTVDTLKEKISEL